jgi:hypothetical protein
VSFNGLIFFASSLRRPIRILASARCIPCASPIQKLRNVSCLTGSANVRTEGGNHRD